MRITISFIVVLTISLFTACESEDENQFYIDRKIDVTVKDNDGNDLLNPDKGGSFSEEDISILYLIDGEMKEVIRPNLEHPKNFFIFEHESEYRMRIFPNDQTDNDSPVTFIKWGENEIDTIKCHIETRENSIICTKVWINGELRWESESLTDRHLEIIK